MRADYVEAVLAVVELIPPGRVLTYGDIAEILGTGGPRQVGAVMSRYGSAVPWWRVIRAGGYPPECHEHRAWLHYRAEDTPMRPGHNGGGAGGHDGSPRAEGADDGTAADAGWRGCRVDLRRARWLPDPADFPALDVAVAKMSPSSDDIGL